MTRRLAPLAAVVSVLLLLVGPALLPVGAQADTEHLEVLAADARSPETTELVLTWTGDESALQDMTVTEQGEPREVQSVERVDDTTAGLVLVVDNSELMDAALADAKRAATGLVENLPQGTEVAVVGIGGGAQVYRGFSDDPEVVLAAVDGLVADGSPATLDGLKSAADLFAAEEALQPNVVLITGTADGGSASTFGQARGELSLVGAPVQVIGFASELFDQASFEQLVEVTGGRMLVAANSDGIEDLGAVAAEAVGRQYRVTYPPITSDEATDVADVTVTVGDVSTSISYVRGSATQGASRLAPVENAGGSGVGFLQNSLVKYLALALAGLATGLAVYALVMVFQRDDSALDTVLRPYAEGFVEGEDEGGGEERTAIIQRAVDMTEEFAEKQGFLATVEGKLERADLPLRAAEALFFYGAGVLIVTLLAFVLSGNLLATLIIAAVVAMIPAAVVNYLASRRRKAFVAQLPDTLQLLSGTLRAGYSLMQGVEAVSKEVDDPIGAELRRVVTESRLGRPLEEALESAAERMDSEDFSWAVMAIRIQREVGGNLAELLLTVAETMTQRERLRRDVAALTAEGKISAIVLGLLPPGLGVAMFLINPGYIGVLFEETIGNFMLGFAILLAGFGFWWMKKTIEIDI